jgi:hypothetical protein
VGVCFEQLGQLAPFIDVTSVTVRRARSASAHSAPSAIARSSSARRAAFPSTSKKPLEQGEAAVEFLETLG